jgi:hypothetical protein
MTFGPCARCVARAGDGAGDGDPTRMASLEAVETVVAVPADLRLTATGWPRDPVGCLRLWPVRGPDG